MFLGWLRLKGLDGRESDYHERDHDAFAAAVKCGRLQAQTGL